MKTLVTTLSTLALTVSATAQTAHTTAHRTTATHTAAPAAGGCITVPALSPKIPALAAGTPCVKALYTVTHRPDSTIDYMSPLVGPVVRASLDLRPSTYSLGYIDITLGTGAPVLQSKFVSVKYTGYLIDGTKFDSSYDHPGADPINFPYGGHRVIPGWDTGFEGMKVGGKRRLFIPYQLAYGENGRPPVIPAAAELIFDIEVVAQSDTAPAPPAPKPAPQPTPATNGAAPTKPADAPKP